MSNEDIDDNDDDFYMILPSNGCKDIHPENTANKFITSWESPINFNGGEWKVALTEANLSYTSTTLNRDFGINTYEPSKREVYFKGRLVGNVAKGEVSLVMPDLPYSAIPDVMIHIPFVKVLG